MKSGRTLSREQIEALEAVSVSAGWRGHYRRNAPPMDQASTRVIGPIPNDLLQPFPAVVALGFPYHDPWQSIPGFDRGRGDGDLWFHDVKIEVQSPKKDDYSPLNICPQNKWRLLVGAASRPTILSGIHLIGITSGDGITHARKIHINDERFIMRIEYDNDFSGGQAAAGSEMDIHLAVTLRYSRRAWLPRDLI